MNNLIKKSKNHFTLIELLVVLSIFFILLNLTVASLNKIQISANQAVCMNNLRNMSNATSLYQDDFDGKFMPMVFSGNFWPKSLLNLGYSGSKVVKEVFHCPERMNLPTNTRPPWGYNNKMASISVSELSKPSETFVFIECRRSKATEIPDNGFYVVSKSFGKRGPGYIPFHRGLGNISFGDGHIEALDPVSFKAKRSNWDP